MEPCSCHHHGTIPQSVGVQEVLKDEEEILFRNVEEKVRRSENTVVVEPEEEHPVSVLTSMLALVSMRSITLAI